MNLITKNSEMARLVWDRYINTNSIAVDATCGNGNDTLYLAQRVRHVYGFDIQKQAIENTGELLKQHQLDNCTLICDGHENIDKYISEPIDLAVYNLGYLPKGDKSITTTANGTISSLEKVLGMLNINGLVSLTLYWGHPEGREEREKVLEYVRTLDSSRFHVLYMQLINQENTPPELLFITRKKKEVI